MKLLSIVGSLNSKSYNRLLLQAIREHVPEGVSVDEAQFGHIGHFNQDLEADFPKEATELKNLIRASDGVIIITPEYNRSIPGALKNAIDWTSRPSKDNPWVRKPVYVMSASTGNHVGAANAQNHLKQVLLYLDACVLGQPEFFLAKADEKFDTKGSLSDKDARQFLTSALDTFIEFVTHFSPQKK